MKNLFILTTLLKILAITSVRSREPSWNDLEIYHTKGENRIYTNNVYVLSNMTWKIKGIEKHLNSKQKLSISSNTFKTPVKDLDLKILLEIDPAKDDTKLTAYLICVSSTYSDVKFSLVSISIIDRNSAKSYTYNDNYHMLECSADNKKGLGPSSMKSKSELLKKRDTYIPNGALTFYATIDGIANFNHTSSECRSSSQPIPDNWFTARLRRFSASDLHSDARIIVNGQKTFAAHKLILATGSKILAITLMAYTKRSETAVIYLKDVEEDAVAEALDFMYSGQAPNIMKLLWGVWRVAYKLDIAGLRELCSETACRNLNVHNALDTYTKADEYRAEWLVSRVRLFMNAQIVEILANPAYPAFVAAHRRGSNDSVDIQVDKIVEGVMGNS